jgi:hypothetical protein
VAAVALLEPGSLPVLPQPRRFMHHDVSHFNLAPVKLWTLTPRQIVKKNETAARWPDLLQMLGAVFC